jgi:hypothetical protein
VILVVYRGRGGFWLNASNSHLEHLSVWHALRWGLRGNPFWLGVTSVTVWFVDVVLSYDLVIVTHKEI